MAAPRPLSEKQLDDIMADADAAMELVLEGLDVSYPEAGIDERRQPLAHAMWQDRRKLVKTIGQLSGHILILVGRVESREVLEEKREKIAQLFEDAVKAIRGCDVIDDVI